MKIIGLWSPGPQQGKSTIASYLATQHGYARLPFAAPLKRMTHQLLRELGHSDERIAEMDACGKMVPIHREIPTTLRSTYQTLGTDWGRKLIHPNIWVVLWLEQLAALRKLVAGSSCPGIVVDDVRFQNEMDCIVNEGGTMWTVSRPGCERGDHASEQWTPDETYVSRAFLNDHGVHDLLSTVEMELWL